MQEQQSSSNSQGHGEENSEEEVMRENPGKAPRCGLFKWPGSRTEGSLTALSVPPPSCDPSLPTIGQICRQAWIQHLIGSGGITPTHTGREPPQVSPVGFFGSSCQARNAAALRRWAGLWHFMLAESFFHLGQQVAKVVGHCVITFFIFSAPSTASIALLFPFWCSCSSKMRKEKAS